MQPYIYVFDSKTANEAAAAVKAGQFDNIIQFHANRHSQQGPMVVGPPNQGNLTPQKMQERASKLDRLSRLARSIEPTPPSQQPPNQQQQQQQPPPQHQQPPQQDQSQLVLPPPPPSGQQQLDPITQMANMMPGGDDNFGHTVHHRPETFS